MGENNKNWDRDGFTKILNSEWFESKSGYSLSLALAKIETDDEIWILYSDILFRDLNLSMIGRNKNIVFIDNDWETRIKDRKSRDSSLIELVKNDNDKNINQGVWLKRASVKANCESIMEAFDVRPNNPNLMSSNFQVVISKNLF